VTHAALAAPLASSAEAVPATLPVLHYVPAWLPQTCTWLYTQVTFLPPWVRSEVAAEGLANLDQFPFERIHTPAEGARWRALLDRAAQRVGLRRELSFLERRLDASRPRVLHSHFGPWGWRNARAARRRSLAHAVTFYGYDVNQVPRDSARWRRRYESLFADVDRVLCEGPHMGRCIQALGCPPEKVTVQRLGVDTARIEYRPRRWEPGEPLRVLMAGTFREKKGFPYALEALGRLSRHVDVRVTVIGDATAEARDQRQKALMLEAIARHGLEDRVRFAGYRPHAELLAAAYEHHVFLSPSVEASDGDTEGGSPVAITEMAASGMPVVSTTHCDIPQAVVHGRTGFLAPERDVDALVDGLGELVSGRVDWPAMSAAARTHVEERFDARRQGQALAGVYRTMAGA
jgi:colanic acid/amylovoran biosynthesis glycosyltransferase